MIKFFRKIRLKLVGENKISKYLLYAIGEIILVVIGILIALGVNNWNENKKNNKLGKDLLSRIHHDLVQDTVQFRSKINSNNTLRNDIKQVLVDLYNGVDSIPQVQQMSAIYDQSLDQVFSPNDNTYKSILSSGTLGLITNIELKENIVDLYSEYDETKNLLNSISQWMGGVAIAVDTQTEFIKFNGEVIDIFTTAEMLNKNDYAFLNNKEDPRFKMVVRAISSTAFNQNVRNKYYSELIARSSELINKIEEDLK
jgi:hypothetical protein